MIGWSLVAFATKYMEAASKHISPVSYAMGARIGAYLVWKHGQL